MDDLSSIVNEIVLISKTPVHPNINKTLGYHFEARKDQTTDRIEIIAGKIFSELANMGDLEQFLLKKPEYFLNLQKK